jgi:hypothetical protein
MPKKKSLDQFLKNYRTFSQKIVTKFSKIWIWDPGSEIRKKPISDPGSRDQKGTGSRIRIRNTEIIANPDSRGQEHADPTDPDLEHSAVQCITYMKHPPPYLPPGAEKDWGTLLTYIFPLSLCNIKMWMLVLQNEQLCLNEGFCLPDCDREPFYRCSCPAGWEGPTCNLKVLIFLIAQGAFYGIVVTYVYNLKVPIRKDFFSSPT